MVITTGSTALSKKCFVTVINALFNINNNNKRSVLPILKLVTKPGVFRLDITSTLLSGFSCWSFYRPPKFIRFWTGLWSSKLQLKPNPIGLTDLNILVKHLWLFAVISILTVIMSERVEQLTIGLLMTSVYFVTHMQRLFASVRCSLVPRI